MKNKSPPVLSFNVQGPQVMKIRLLCVKLINLWGNNVTAVKTYAILTNARPQIHVCSSQSV